jgi:DNA-binding winged helix-turn-helix (wHTH) protein
VFGSPMIRFQTFRLDTTNQCLWQGESRVELTPKAFGVLRYLVEHAGRLVTPEELLEALWPATYVNPEVLRKYVLEIRRALGDRPDKPVFIETRPKRGYQFVASVIDESAAGTLSPEGTKTIVGREPALAELGGYLARAQRNERQVLFITGEAGIGKTALVDEFQRRAGVDVPRICIVRGQCVEGYGGKEPYYPVLEAVGQLCRISGGDSVVQTLARQAPTWLVQLPALLTQEHREMLQREIQGATRDRMLREISEALETIASDRPLLLIFEDLHWGDHSTITRPPPAFNACGHGRVRRRHPSNKSGGRKRFHFCIGAPPAVSPTDADRHVPAGGRRAF